MSLQPNQIRAKKMMLWFSMISITMTFGGLTSAYVVSKSRPDWLSSFELPWAFYWSTLAIVLSSVSFWWAKKNLHVDNASSRMGLWTTLGLALVFVVLQFQGFGNLIAEGYYFTGAESNVTTSFLYVLVLVHLAHLAGGLIVLVVVLTNHYRGKYQENPLGFSLAHTFWHFLGFLWLYLFVFLYLLR
ncbi:MAG: cytochrome c oxidase subunit 3 [Flavobacteriaceae bacterium]